MWVEKIKLIYKSTQKNMDELLSKLCMIVFRKSVLSWVMYFQAE